MSKVIRCFASQSKLSWNLVVAKTINNKSFRTFSNDSSEKKGNFGFPIIKYDTETEALRNMQVPLRRGFDETESIFSFFIIPTSIIDFKW